MYLDAASVNIQPNNIITLNVNLALVAEIDIYLLTFPAVDHQQLSVTGHVEIQGDLQNGYKLVFVHDPISLSFFGVNINAFPDNIEINLGSSILPESISSLFTSGIPQITTNDNEIIFGFNFQGPRFYTFKNNFAGVSNGGVINVNGVQNYSPSSVEVTAGGLVTATAIDQTIDCVQYVFTNWSNGSISRTTTFSKEGTYTANFISVLSATMSGPGYLAKGEIGTWTVTASGGTSPYSYKWSYYVYCSDIALAKSQSKGSGDVIPNALPCGYWVPVNNNTTNTLTKSSDGRAFQLKCIVTDATSKTYTVTKDVSGGTVLPKQQEESGFAKEYNTELLANNPNPFNPSTRISYSLKTEGKVSIKIYNTLGEEVITLVDEIKPAGIYETEFNASELPSGIYIYRMQVGEYVSSKKMLLLK